MEQSLDVPIDPNDLLGDFEFIDVDSDPGRTSRTSRTSRTLSNISSSSSTATFSTTAALALPGGDVTGGALGGKLSWGATVKAGTGSTRGGRPCTSTWGEGGWSLWRDLCKLGWRADLEDAEGGEEGVKTADDVVDPTASLIPLKSPTHSSKHRYRNRNIARRKWQLRHARAARLAANASRRTPAVGEGPGEGEEESDGGETVEEGDGKEDTAEAEDTTTAEEEDGGDQGVLDTTGLVQKKTEYEEQETKTTNTTKTKQTWTRRRRTKTKAKKKKKQNRYVYLLPGVNRCSMGEFGVTMFRDEAEVEAYVQEHGILESLEAEKMSSETAGGEKAGGEKAEGEMAEGKATEGGETGNKDENESTGVLVGEKERTETHATQKTQAMVFKYSSMQLGTTVVEMRDAITALLNVTTLGEIFYV